MMRWTVAVCAVVAVLLNVSCAKADGRELRLETLVEGVEQPVALTHDGTDRIFIVEQPGRIRVFVDGELQKQPYLDIARRVRAGGECGLLGLAFHPDFQKNGLFYVNYTAGGNPLRTVIAEFRADPKALTVDPATEREVLTFDQPFSNHNGGHVAFGPDGKLYIATGDGGAAGDPHNNGQNLGTLLGKILRIDVTPRQDYAIPPDNPFVDRAGARPEIWAYGLRNPWRFSFDRATDTLYAGDVGQNQYEEIDVIVKGGNYGWREREGLHAYQNGRDSAQFIDPIYEYPRNKGLSVTGGYVYRGQAAPSLTGIYFFGDYSSGRVWGLRYENGALVSSEEFNVTHNGRSMLNRLLITSFGEDAAGEVYLCHHGGTVYRLVAD